MYKTKDTTTCIFNFHKTLVKMKIFSISDISSYRSELMGWAIMWIMMLHFTFTQIKPLGFLAQYGFTGVDIFMLVSGFGLYFSLEKHTHIFPFYKKRFLRIFPAYYIIGFFSSILLYQDSILSYLFRYTTIGFWTGGVYGDWYIPSIVFLYIFMPFIKKLYDRKLWIIIISICGLCLIVSYILVANNNIPKSEPHFFLLYRIPSFLFGVACAYWVKNGFSNTYYYYILVAGIPFFIYLYPHHHEIYNYKYFSTVFLLPIITFLLIVISRHCSPINPYISKIGQASLEIYIIQGIFFHAIITEMITIPAEYHDIISILFIILSSTLGIVTHWLIDKTGIIRVF